MKNYEKNMKSDQKLIKKRKLKLWHYFLIGGLFMTAVGVTVLSTLLMVSKNIAVDKWKTNWVPIEQLNIQNGVLLGANESFDPNSTQYDTLVIPKNVKTINKKAFYASSSDRSILKNIHYLKFETKSQCQEIQESAFSMAASLIGDLILPNSLVTIGSDAFLNCNFDQKITLDAKIENIGVDAFFRCKFNNITNSSHHFAFASAAGDARILIKNNVSRDFNYVSDQPVGCLATGHLIIPDNTLTIGEYAFYGCNGLTGDLEIPSSVTDVGYQAFGGCESINYDTSTFNGVAGTIRCSKGASKWIISADTSIQSINLSGTLSNVVGIAGGCFENCKALTDTTVVLDPNILTIGKKAFWQSNITTVSAVTNSKLKHIGEKAFGSCLSLTSANFKSANDLDKIDSVVFISCDHLTRLSFPWTQQIPNGVATIGSANGAALGSIVYNSGTVELPLTAKGNVTLQDFIGIGLQNTWIVEYN